MNHHLSETQAQTQGAFSFKWAQTETYASPKMRKEWSRWLLEKYFDGNKEGPRDFLDAQRPLRILDAGCGAGVSALLLFGDLLKEHEYVGVDISESVHEARRNFSTQGIPGRFIQADISDLPEELGTFDVIFSEGVLHHTDSVSGSIDHLASRLNPGGALVFYVYARKAPLREFADDHIRHAISRLTDEEAWNELMPLTRLGQSLGEIGATINVEEDIRVLGIPAGTYDIQRLFYYAICKAYYQPEYSLDEMNHINFDWYRPLNCHRHSPEEMRGFVESSGLRIERIHVEPSGMTVLARRQDS